MSSNNSINNGSMRVKIGGSRGSLPVSGPQYNKTGGNTTSLRVYSSCLPPKTALIIDGGTGFLPLSNEALKEGANHLMILLTHHHHDHSQGLFIAPTTFNPQIRKSIWGPVESNVGPQEAFKNLMKPPYHPVPAERVLAAFSFQNLETPSAFVFLFHPQADNPVIIPVDQYELIVKKGTGMIDFGGKNLQKFNECLLVRMYWSNHPERTICYRFEELPTGKIFVFLTDHENMAELPLVTQKHLENAGLLIMDSQYSEEAYHSYAKGFGHGTPEYCVDVAVRCGVSQLGLTHHDPSSSDDYLETVILKAATDERERRCVAPEGGGMMSLKSVFLCMDGLVIEV